MASPKVQQIDLTKLSLHQLTQLKQQLDHELSFFQNSLAALKHAYEKFQDSSECLDKLTAAAEGKEMLVPLTTSIYVPGIIGNASNVIIDIGTGYYVEKSVEAGKDYFKRKVQYVTEQMEKIQHIGMEKARVQEAVNEVMEMKLQSHLAAQMHGVHGKD